MKSYKVEIEQMQKYVIDVQAKDEAEAEKKARTEWNKACENGTYHYLEYGDTETDFGTVYDVTGTDDEYLGEEHEDDKCEHGRESDMFSYCNDCGVFQNDTPTVKCEHCGNDTIEKSKCIAGEESEENRYRKA